MSWRLGASIAVVVSLAQLPPLFVGNGPVDWETAAETSGLIVAAMLLLSGIVAYVHWRLEQWSSSAVLAAGLVAVALNAGVVAVGRLRLPAEAGVTPWLLVTQTGILCLLAAVAARSGRQPSTALDPCLAGFTLGAAAALVSAFVFVLAPPVVPDVTGQLLLVAGLLVAYAVICLTVLDEVTLPRWVRARVCAAVAVLGVAQVIAYLPHSPAGVVTLIAMHSIGTAVLCTTLLGLLFGALRDHRLALADLEDRVERVEAGALAQRVTLHEIRGTMGGIATASRLVHDDRLSADRRGDLQSMIDSELERLGRLMDDRSSEQTELVALDEILRPLVVRQQVQGRSVAWQPTGLHCWGRADDVAEIVNILLENSRRHAPGTTTTLNVHDRDAAGGVTIRVSDTGDGIPCELRSRVFGWGVRRSGSPGQGLGLPLARRLAGAMGGSLVLEDTTVGASFRADLPALDQAQDVESGDEQARRGGECHHVGAVVGQA